MDIVGCMLFVIGCVATCIGEVMILAFAYKRSVGSFFACLFLPFFSWLYLVLYVRPAAKPFGLVVAGLLLVFLGAWLGDIEL